MMTLPNIAILADSRGFDTYFLNPAYGEAGYGYDRTFAFVLRRALLSEADPVADVCHIPDHFRAATIENNIIRLGLTDPAMVVLLDGIWETLLSKADFLRWAEREISDHEWRDGEKLDLSFDIASSSCSRVDNSRCRRRAMPVANAACCRISAAVAARLSG